MLIQGYLRWMIRERGWRRCGIDQNPDKGEYYDSSIKIGAEGMSSLLGEKDM
jgi:hypothetical protein